ncbi:MAG: ATP-dependent zinc metalloprotease FtsH [Eubacterium sp.]|nr:ATP-dependent zinc metalloprotease FtsH [Eubacterium sp.]
MSRRRGIGTYIFVIGVLIILFLYLPNLTDRGENVTNSQYQEYLTGHKINSAIILQNAQVPTGSVIFTLEDGTEGRIYVTDVNEAARQLEEQDTEVTVRNVSREGMFETVALPVLMCLLLAVVVIVFMNRQSGAAGGTNAKMMNFGKNRAHMSTEDEKKMRFDDVAGLEEEKEDLQEIVEFLRDPQKYVQVGARIPTGVLLVGPPGTGKTLLAKAVAGEAGVPFFSISGSDFVEMFVGVGASRVRDLFEDAKRHAPCIIFIDEIDAVARRRGSGMGGGHDEREQTLNQLLVEIDGFGPNENIIVMAATNRVDILDPAILRPGRFDRRVAVGRPDVRGREEILKVHAKGKPLGDDVDLAAIAQTTAGFTGADLENLLNEAAISAAKQNRVYLTQADIKGAFVKVGIGTEKRSKIISEKEKWITAYHEAGHAILFHVLPDMDPVYSISIIPTGPGAAGYTMSQPEQDEIFNTRSKMLQHITVSLGGRVAEEMVFDDITTGASQDIKQATQIARSMVMQYGMSAELGLVNYGSDSEEIFIGRDWGQTKNFSEKVAAKIDDEVYRIIQKCHDQATNLITEHRYVLEETAKQLIAKEKLNRSEFEAIFEAEAKQNETELGDLHKNEA